MAITGLIMPPPPFVTVHMIANLQAYLGAEAHRTTMPTSCSTCNFTGAGIPGCSGW